MDDEKIVLLLWNRAENAIEALQSRFGKLIYGICYRILRHRQDAQECVNDTYLALWNAIPPTRPDPLTPYVCRTGRNVALNRLRADSAAKRDAPYCLSIDELAEAIPDTCMEQCVTAKALGMAIDDFLARQNRENRVLFVRRYWFGDSVGEAAKVLGISANTASARLMRMRQKLKDELIERGLFDDGRSQGKSDTGA